MSNLVFIAKGLTNTCTGTAISVMSFAKEKAAKLTPLMAARDVGVML